MKRMCYATLSLAGGGSGGGGGGVTAIMLRGIFLSYQPFPLICISPAFMKHICFATFSIHFFKLEIFTVLTL